MYGYGHMHYGCGAYEYGPGFAGLGPRGWHGRGQPGRCWRYGVAATYPRRADLVRALEEYQKDLEQELLDVAERLKELKGSQAE